MSQLKRRIFYINSRNLLTGTENTFHVPLEIPEWEVYTHATVLQASIPISYYLVQQGQNTFVLQEGKDQVTIPIPPGNYNTSSFAYTIPPLLNAASPHGYTYAMKFPVNYQSGNDGKFIFVVNHTTQQPSFIFTATNPVAPLFGFDLDSTVQISSSGTQSTNVVNFVPETTIFVHTNLIGGEQNDVLFEVYNSSNVPPFGVISWLNPAPIESSRKLAPAKSRSVTFSVTDENNLPLFLNGVNLVFTLMLFRDRDIDQKTVEWYKYNLKKDTM